jgi:hypothetical protein
LRTISAGQQLALERGHGMPILFVEVDWLEGLERYCTAAANVTWNSATWTGVGDMIDIGPVSTTEGVQATGVRFTMALIGSARVAQALATKSQGRRVTMWFGTLNPDTHVLDDTPIIEFEGRLDAPQLQDGATSTISITAESRMAKLVGASVRRYTDADQQKYHPGDTWCSFAAVMAERLILFPSAAAQRQ